MITKEGLVLPDEYKGHSFAPGYRDVSLRFEVNEGNKVKALEIQLSKENVLRLLRDLEDVQEVAWRDDGPIDIEPHEVEVAAEKGNLSTVRKY